MKKTQRKVQIIYYLNTQAGEDLKKSGNQKGDDVKEHGVKDDTTYGFFEVVETTGGAGGVLEPATFLGCLDTEDRN